MKACIVGFGRAGRVQLEAANAVDHIDIVQVVDECPSQDSPPQKKAKASSVDATNIPFAALTSSLQDPKIDAVIVTTPTNTHFSVCKAALQARKHVFVETPLATTAEQIQELYDLAARNEVMLYTAFNRRHDPEWLRLEKSLEGEYPFCVNVICRDYPHPPAAHIASCGGILRDSALHELDMLCVILRDTPVLIEAEVDETGENASVMMTFSKGCRVHMVHARHAPSFEQRVTVWLSKRSVEMGPAASEVGVSFRERYRASYQSQMQDFCERVRRGETSPNLPLDHAQYLERLVAACEDSNQSGERVNLQTLRQYDACQRRVFELYKAARQYHTLETNRALIAKYTPGKFGTHRLRDIMNDLSRFVDLSDPDVDTPNTQHALQTAESIRRAGLPDWLQFTGLIHDFGKMLFKWGNDEDGTSLSTQFSIVGDTFVVGCKRPEGLVYPQLNELSPEASLDDLGVYKPKCGLDALEVSFGHDEYLFRVLQHSDTTLPRIALDIVRYHSLYAWHDKSAYAELESDSDKLLKGWVKLFNQHDLYSKRKAIVEEESVWKYYEALEAKFLPHGFRF